METQIDIQCIRTFVLLKGFIVYTTKSSLKHCIECHYLNSIKHLMSFSQINSIKYVVANISLFNKGLVYGV